MKHIFQRGMAIVAVAASMLAVSVVGASAANAADTSTDDASITINSADGKGDDVNGHTFAAVRLGAYDMTGISTDANGNYSGVNVTELQDSALNSAILAAVKKSDIVASVPEDNTIAWVAKQFQDSATYPYGGQMRNFLTALVASDYFVNTAVPAATSNKQTATGSNGTAEFSNLAEGVYVVVDTSSATQRAGYTASIPMFVETKIGGKDLSSQTLGIINIKNQALTMTKTMVNVDAQNPYVSGGENVEWKLTSAVPNTTGYTAFTYAFTETMSKDLTYVPDSVKVVIGSGDSAKTLTLNDDYTVTATVNADGTTTLVIDLSRSILEQANGASVNVTYDSEVNGTVNVLRDDLNNSASLAYSSSPSDATDITTTVPIAMHVYTFGFSLVKEDRITKSKLEGVQFTVAKSGSDTPIKFTKVNGNYIQDPNGQSATQVLSTDVNGKLNIGGLAPGDYQVSETKPLDGYVHMALPSFTVTITGTEDNSNQNYLSLGDQSVAGLVSFSNNVFTVDNVTSLTQLPLTGGAGLIMFAVIAVILGSAAGIVLFRAKRSSQKI
ncbi:SpaH/EbpB family LPXTG-anchored major pilin [Bifidobacterium aquikefiri]|uniref:SpaH/EbpB family LPXTG-anchored major pilin n=1 Tax=Bifidobacterium aquikefiri TaxID=1653207 RepID=UPI0023F3B097|nr:SpaH/EbpB family LPXTG-anchored major pilin [Bifidobacterium aquikefiri]